MAIGDIVTDAELNAPATTAPGAVFTDADLDAMDDQAASLATINKAYAASFADSDQNRVAMRQAATGAVPTFSYSTGVPGSGPLQGPRVFTSQELDAQAADSLEDPNTILTLNQYQDAKEAAQRLGRDSVAYQAPKALGGLLQTAYGASKELRDNVGMEAILGGPGAVVRKLIPSAYEGILRKGPVGSVGFWSGVQNSLNNSFNAKQHQIDAANELASAGALTGAPEDQQKLIDDRAAQLALAAGDGPEDVKLRDWQNYAFHKGIDQEMVNPQMTKLPGQDLLPKPLPNLSDAAAMLSPTPENLTMIAAGELGGPLLGTAVKATSGRALSAIASGGMKVDQAVIDAGAAMGRKIEDITGFAPATLKKAGDFVAGAGGISAVGGVVGAVDPEYSKAAAEAAIAYGLLRKGAAIIRVGAKAAGTAGVFFREAADPMGPLRAEAIRSMALDPSIPEAYRAGMLSTASAIDSTPKRIAANPELSDNVRKLGRALSNPAVVAGVRGAGAIAEGGAAGALSMTPLMLASQNEGEPGSLAVTGAAMGAIGRGLGLVGSRAGQVNADIGRFLVDAQLSGGNVERTALLPRNRLEQMASFQGMLNRKGVDLIPLSGQEYSANIMALGGTPGSAGFHLETPADGGRPRVLVNLDAKAVSEGHEFSHAIAASNVLGGRIRADIFNWVNQTYGTAGVLARGREYVKRVIESEDRAYEAQYASGNAPIRSLPDMESRISMRVDELGQQSLKEGNADPLDWARNEIWAEQLSNGGIDLNKIRRGTPLGIDPAAMGESILGGASRVLRTLGVAIDDQTGKVQGSLSSIFKENPLVGNSPKLRKALANYVEAYDRWLPGVAEESTKSAPGIRVAPTGNITDFINSPLTKLHETRPGIRENEFILEENGVPRFKTQAEINADAKAKEAQVGMLYTPGRLLPRDSSEFGPRKIDGRIVVGGPVLPAQFDGLAHFSPYLRKAARDVEANRAAGGPGSSFNVIYHRIGTSESGTFKVINRGNTEAVMREVVPFGWRVSNANKILANVLDMTALRGSVMKALNEGRMGIFNHSLDQFSGDLKTYFANHSQGLAGENRIGLAKKNAIDSFLFAGATKANRAANPVYGDFGTRGTIRTLRLDRIQSIEPTGRGGLHFDYDKSNHNLMPDVTDRPVGQAMPDVFHGTTEPAARKINKTGFDVEKSADGTIWFTDNRREIERGNVAASGSGAIIQRHLDEGRLKLGGWAESDKYSTDQLINMGYDGLKLPGDGETTYQIFHPEKLTDRPVGQAMPDVGGDEVSGGLPRRNMPSFGRTTIDENGTITYQGKQPQDWTPEDFQGFGEDFGVRDLGPLSPVKRIVDELGRPVAEIPGGLEGKFTYYDLLHLKANPVDVHTLPVDLHAQLTAKLARTMTPEKGNDVQKFNGIIFGMLSPNAPLLPNEIGQARLRMRTMEDIRRFAGLLPDNPTKEQKQAVNTKLKDELGFKAANKGGLGIPITADLSNVVMAAKMFVKSPEFFIKRPNESWADFIDKLTTQVPGLGTKTASFAGVWQDPLMASISAMDRHMARIFAEELVGNPEIRKSFEGIVLRRFNASLEKSQSVAREFDRKIKRSSGEKLAKLQEDRAKALKKLPDPTLSVAKTLDDVLGQADIFGADKVKDFLNEAVFAAMGSRKAKLMTKKGINPNLPDSIKGVEWVETPKDFQVMSDAYRAALELNAKRAKEMGIEIFPAQWTLWDRIRQRVEPHEAMFPGLEKLPALNDAQLSRAYAANKSAGYMTTPAEGKAWRRKKGIDPADLAYFSIPILGTMAASALSGQGGQSQN